MDRNQLKGLSCCPLLKLIPLKKKTAKLNILLFTTSKRKYRSNLSIQYVPYLDIDDIPAMIPYHHPPPPLPPIKKPAKTLPRLSKTHTPDHLPVLTSLQIYVVQRYNHSAALLPLLTPFSTFPAQKIQSFPPLQQRIVQFIAASLQTFNSQFFVLHRQLVAYFLQVCVINILLWP